MKLILANKQKIQTGFYFCYSVLIFAVIGLSLIFFTKRGFYLPIQTVGFIGLKAADIALVLYTITLVPGILGRFNVRNSLFVVLTSFRREFGIFTYLFVLAHLWLTVLVPSISFRMFSLGMPFQLAGSLAAILLLMLFITSNNYAMQKLKQNWKKIHKLTYPALGLIFLHLALVRLSIWTILAGSFVVLELASFMTSRTNSKGN